MSELMYQQAGIFLSTVLCGAVLGASYDCLRVARRVIKHNTIGMMIEDIVYWIIAGIFMFYVLYSKNEGTLRAFTLLGMAIGLIVYHMSIGRLLMLVSVFLIKKLILIINKIIGIICLPIFFIKKLLTKILNKPINDIRDRMKNRKSTIKIKHMQKKKSR